jgi:hypothetical protein
MPMRSCDHRVKLILFLLPGAEGPSDQTDDPVPVDLHHYDFFVFGRVDGTPPEIDSTGPAFEFNWGAILFQFRKTKDR